MKTNIFQLLFLTTILTSCLDQPVVIPNTPSDNFEALWKIVDTKYCYLDYKQINWDSIHQVYKSKVDSFSIASKDNPDKKQSDRDFFTIMSNMLAELKDGHVNLYSPFNRSRYWNWYQDYPSNFNSSLIYSTKYLGKNYGSINGLQYEKIAGGKIGYIYYGSFSDNFRDQNLKYIFDYFSDCQALIIDVRNNGGGSADLAKTLATCFFNSRKTVSYFRHKTGSGHSDFGIPTPEIIIPDSQKAQWKLPVAVLTNRLSYSATNDFACMMKQAPNAILVGDKTGGGGGLPMSSELPNGWMVRLSQVQMLDADMNQIEWGINPTYPCALIQSDIDKGDDTIIEKAVALMIK
jgi:C-terminal processing protease CtpA/Prc